MNPQAAFQSARLNGETRNTSGQGERVEELFTNPLLLLVAGYFLARWDKRGDQQTGGAISFAALQASIEEKFKTVFKRLDGLDDSREKHDKSINELVGQVHELVTRLDMLLGLGRNDAIRQRQSARAMG